MRKTVIFLIAMRKTVIFLIAMRKMTLVKIFENFFLIFQWFIQKIENLQFNIFSPYKMGQNTCKNFQKWNFSKIAQNLLIHPENWKSQNQFFPIQNGSKHFKNRIFQKCSIIWFEIFMCKLKLTEKNRPNYFQGNSWKLENP